MHIQNVKGQINSINIFWGENGNISFSNVGWNSASAMPTQEQKDLIAQAIKDIQAVVLKTNEKLKE